MKVRNRYVRLTHGLLALVAGVFGLATIMAGAKVLAGSDPGYTVYRPLLIYNTTMGAAYLAAAVMAWRHPGRAKQAAGAIFALNLLVLGGVGYLYWAGGAVAVHSLRAMTLRTVVWLLVFLGWAWTTGEDARSDPKLSGGSSVGPETSTWQPARRCHDGLSPAAYLR
jgi:hypothetical protein